MYVCVCIFCVETNRMLMFLVGNYKLLAIEHLAKCTHALWHSKYQHNYTSAANESAAYGMHGAIYTFVCILIEYITLCITRCTLRQCKCIICGWSQIGAQVSELDEID